MAINWTAAEAVKVLREGKDKDAIVDIGKRFPLFAIAAQSEKGLLDMILSLPENMSARKLNGLLDENFAGIKVERNTEVDDEDEEEVEEKPAKKAPAKKEKVEKEEDAEATDYDAISVRNLMAMLKERGIPYQKGWKKVDIIEALVADDNGEGEVEEEEEKESEYDAMSLKELVALARERKIKLVKGMKKPDIVKLLVEADEADEEDDFDFDEEEEEEEEVKPAKKAKKAKKTPAKKAKPADDEDEDEDDDDDWDI